MISDDTTSKLLGAAATVGDAVPLLTTIATALGLAVAPELAVAGAAIAAVVSAIGSIRSVDVDSLKPGMAAATAAAAQLELDLG